MPVGSFHKDNLSEGGFDGRRGTVVEAFFFPFRFRGKAEEEDYGQKYHFGLGLKIEPADGEDIHTEDYSGGSLLMWAPTMDPEGDEPAGFEDWDEVREAGEVGGTSEYEISIDDEEYHGYWPAAVPDENGELPEDEEGNLTRKMSKRSNFGKLLATLYAEGGEEFEEIVSPDIRCLVGLDAEWANIKSTLLPAKIYELPSGDSGGGKKGKSGKSKGGTKAKGDKAASKAKGGKSKAGTKSKAKKGAEVDEDVVEAAILKAIGDGEINTAEAIKAARGAYKKEGVEAAKAAMEIAKDDDWLGDDARPWEFDEEESVLRVLE